MKRIEHKIENGIELKWCGRCKKWLPLNNFSFNKVKWDGLQERCSECRHIHWKTIGCKTRKEVPVEIKRKRKRAMVLKYHNITQKEFDSLLKIQNNKCAICGSPDWGRPSPCIDHDHSTGKIRGLLCNRCNRTLGFTEDSVSLLFKMAKYLKKNGK